MKKLTLIKNPILFQGEKYLDKNKTYFEGWYFKNTINDYGISFIPGISINNDEKKAFIQVITNDSSYFINYDITDFSFNDDPFYIKIKDNYFSLDNIHIDIKDKDLNILGDINYSNNVNISTSTLFPNIMGPFSYIPFMECNHGILVMKANAKGFITINSNYINFDEGISYIEKDWGTSFPKEYIWCQGNNFQDKDASFMLSIADIPFKIFNFKGLICVLMFDNKEYRFTTYNNSKIIKYDITDDSLNIILNNGHYYLEIISNYNTGHTLSAPIKGKMEKDILESINEVIRVILKEDNKILFDDISTNCGLEIVNVKKKVKR